jgi:ribosomal-protein-alanine N-acetyltransferase
MHTVLPETKRLYFRQHKPEDLDAYCEMEADPDFRRYVGGRPRPRSEAEQRFLNGLKPVSDGLSMWATIYKPENKYIGRCGVYPHFDSESKPVPGEGALGFYLDKAYWGMGLATEAGAAFVAYGFETHKLNRIVTAIDTRNGASVRVIEKLGFTLEQTEEGNPRSFYHYALNKPDYFANKAI